MKRFPTILFIFFTTHYLCGPRFAIVALDIEHCQPLDADTINRMYIDEMWMWMWIEPDQSQQSAHHQDANSCDRLSKKKPFQLSACHRKSPFEFSSP